MFSGETSLARPVAIPGPNKYLGSSTRYVELELTVLSKKESAVSAPKMQADPNAPNVVSHKTSSNKVQEPGAKSIYETVQPKRFFLQQQSVVILNGVYLFSFGSRKLNKGAGQFLLSGEFVPASCGFLYFWAFSRDFLQFRLLDLTKKHTPLPQIACRKACAPRHHSWGGALGYPRVR